MRLPFTTSLIPKNRGEWTRFAFCIAEATVLGTTGMIVALHFTTERRWHYDFTPDFYHFYAAISVALAIASWNIRRFYPALAVLGWITLVFCLVASSISPPVD